jgi:hypothetical protein
MNQKWSIMVHVVSYAKGIGSGGHPLEGTGGAGITIKRLDTGAEHSKSTFFPMMGAMMGSQKKCLESPYSCGT